MTKKSKKRGKKNKQKIVGLLIIAAFFIAIAAFQVIRERSPSNPRFKAGEYFEILEPIPSGELSEDGSHLFLYYLTFKIKAIKGDANEVFVNSGGLGMAEPVELSTIKEGEEKQVFFSFEQYPLSLFLRGDKFYVSLQITSVEASGMVSISFPPPE